MKKVKCISKTNKEDIFINNVTYLKTYTLLDTWEAFEGIIYKILDDNDEEIEVYAVNFSKPFYETEYNLLNPIRGKDLIEILPPKYFEIFVKQFGWYNYIQYDDFAEEFLKENNLIDILHFKGFIEYKDKEIKENDKFKLEQGQIYYKNDRTIMICQINPGEYKAISLTGPSIGNRICEFTNKDLANYLYKQGWKLSEDYELLIFYK